MRVLRFKRRTHLLVFQISGRKRDVSIRSAVLSAETSNHTLIPALLNLLQRRNSRDPTPPPPGAARPSLISAREAKSSHRAKQCLGLLSMMRRYVHGSGIRDTITDMTESAKLRSIGVSWKPPDRPPRKPERSVLSIYMHAMPLSHTDTSLKASAPKIDFSGDQIKD